MILCGKWNTQEGESCDSRNCCELLAARLEWAESAGSVAVTLFALLEGRGGQGGQTESRMLYLKFSQSQASGSGGARL